MLFLFFTRHYVPDNAEWCQRSIYDAEGWDAQAAARIKWATETMFCLLFVFSFLFFLLQTFLCFTLSFQCEQNIDFVFLCVFDRYNMNTEQPCMSVCMSVCLHRNPMIGCTNWDSITFIYFFRSLFVFSLSIFVYHLIFGWEFSYSNERGKAFFPIFKYCIFKFSEMLWISKDSKEKASIAKIGISRAKKHILSPQTTSTVAMCKII